ncbi:PREDICTED: raftlin [Elephantulus edwardii]|uniref:raftlin n=1 Tax=Elephantulus edwardii TaxID=28737 RepID=UPI0003F0DBE6|nr:PREDICTED: raftlin [Elephantulus edwardii]
MGCGLNKLEKRDEKRPGNIYSTLKRPQVETKIDVAYEYRFLEFTTLSAAELPRSSAVRLASLRDLPTQLQELYQQGFSLATLHPFVQPTQEWGRTPLEHIFRAILVRKTERSQKADPPSEGYILELDCCSSPGPLTEQKVIPEFIKKDEGEMFLGTPLAWCLDMWRGHIRCECTRVYQELGLCLQPWGEVPDVSLRTSEGALMIQEAASQGLKFVGVIPQYRSPGNLTGGPRTPTANSASDPRDVSDTPGLCGDSTTRGPQSPGPVEVDSTQTGTDKGPEPEQDPQGCAPAAEQPDLSSEGDGDGCLSPQMSAALDGRDGGPPDGCDTSLLSGLELFTLFNKPRNQQRCRQYYPVTIPLRVSRTGQSVSSVDANWLEHMSDHFRKGGVLVNVVSHLSMVNDSIHGLTDGVFIFEAVSTEDNKTVQGYDAIVVEQWTVLEGTEVQTDYVPLLNSLAAYGWQLTCVLPTPVVRTTREGNVSTKQIVFLQRPCLPQKLKKKESKFQWRFSREELRSRRLRKSRGRSSAGGRRRAEETEKGLEDPLPKPGGGDQRPGADGEQVGGHVPESRVDKPGPEGGLAGGTVHNGPATLSRDPGRAETRRPCRLGPCLVTFNTWGVLATFHLNPQTLPFGRECLGGGARLPQVLDALLSQRAEDKVSVSMPKIWLRPGWHTGLEEPEPLLGITPGCRARVLVDGGPMSSHRAAGPVSSHRAAGPMCWWTEGPCAGDRGTVSSHRAAGPTCWWTEGL